MVFDYGKVVVSNEREVFFMNTKTSTIENIIIEKVEAYHIDLLSELNKLTDTVKINKLLALMEAIEKDNLL